MGNFSIGEPDVKVKNYNIYNYYNENYRAKVQIRSNTYWVICFYLNKLLLWPVLCIVTVHSIIVLFQNYVKITSTLFNLGVTYSYD